MIGEALKQARTVKKMTQKAIADIGFLSDKTVSAIEQGKRKMPVESMTKVTNSLDYPRLYMEVVEEVTGGAYCSPWLDGEKIDLYKTSVWAKTIEELEEAKKSLEDIDIINKTKNEKVKKQVFESILQALDARVAIDHYTAVLCEEYDISVNYVFKKHREKLEKKGYVKKERFCKR